MLLPANSTLVEPNSGPDCASEAGLPEVIDNRVNAWFLKNEVSATCPEIAVDAAGTPRPLGCGVTAGLVRETRVVFRLFASSAALIAAS
jgi:hypothetical protein